MLVCLMSLSAVVDFAIFPYLTIYLKEQLRLGNAASGLVVGSIALIASCGAWLGGRLVDRVGWLRMLRLAGILYILVFMALAMTKRLEVVICLIMLLGVCQLLREPTLKTALVIHDDGSGRLFKLRYMALTGGAILGPLLSATLSPYGEKISFTYAAIFFTLYLAITFLLHKGTSA